MKRKEKGQNEKEQGEKTAEREKRVGKKKEKRRREGDVFRGLEERGY